MARLVRMVVAGVPRHVTQRDSRQLPMFFRNEYDVPRFTREDVDLWHPSW